MPALKDILAKDIARNIDGVIKANDDRNLLQEVEEYVITREIERELKRFVEGYNEAAASRSAYPYNGVWISGYFGSGKSHLLKILSLVMSGRTVDGVRLRDIFVKKIDDALFRADFEKILALPSTSVLFNIEQHAEQAKAKSENAILYAFERMFNKIRGYYADSGSIAAFERDLDEEGQLDAWKAIYKDGTGRDWDEQRPKALLLGRRVWAETLASFRNIGTDESAKIIDQYDKNYSITVDGFCGEVSRWLDRQLDKRHRINFFVDEVGQFVSENPKLMLSLQTIAETLGFATGGRAWIFVTSQETIDKLIGSLSKHEESDAFSKIIGRFKFRVALSSADVREVIQKRLLEKNESGTELLRDYYHREKESLRTVFAFGEGAKAVHYKDEEAFVYSYPFPAYQYDLLQDALRGLAEHNAFIGAHVSRGERSMLEIFQDVGKSHMLKELFAFAPFDAMYEGIRQSMHTGLVAAINQAEHNIPDELSVRILKALLLVKYVREFKATAENLKVLLADSLDTDLAGLGAKIEEAFARLERETYVRRNGELYEYLTDDEKDVEEEIRHVSAEAQDCRKFIEGIVFGEILKVNRIRYGANGEDYAFQKAIDDETPKGQGDLAIRIATPWHPDAENRNALLARSMARKELIVLLPSDVRFMDELELYLKTDAWLRRTDAKASKYARIYADKQAQNNDRRRRLGDQVKDLAKQADFAVMDQEMGIAGGSPLERMERAFQDLVSRSYPGLRMLKVHFAQESVKNILYASAGLFDEGGAAKSEPESELAAWIMRKHRDSESITLAGIKEEFGKGQFGWYEWAILGVVAQLFVRQEIELIRSSEVLGKDEVFSLLSQNRGHDAVTIRPAPIVTQDDIRKLKDLHASLFHLDNPGTTGKETAIEFKKTLLEFRKTFQESLLGAPDFVFLSAAEESVKKLESLLKNEWPWFLEERKNYESDLAHLVENVIQPLQTFLKGPNAETWRKINDWLRYNQGNLVEIAMPDAVHAIEALRDSPDLYKTSDTKHAKDLWQALIEKEKSLIEAERATAAEKVDAELARLGFVDGWDDLPETSRIELKDGFNDLKNSLVSIKGLAALRDAGTTQATRLFEAGRKEIHEKLHPAEKIVYAGTEEKRVAFSKQELRSPEDVDAYAQALAAEWKKLIAAGKRIGL